MRIAVGGGGYSDACSALYDANRGVADAMMRLATGLDGGASMAGGDTSGHTWAGKYDPAAAKALQSGIDISNALGRMANLTNASLVNHDAADGGAMFPGYGPEYTPSPGDTNSDHYTESDYCPAPPSAGGGTGDVPGWWHWVASHMEGWFWPDADTGKLRSIADVWHNASRSLGSNTAYLDSAIASLQIEKSPEISTAVSACNRLKRNIEDLAGEFTKLGNACSDYATDVDNKHQEAENELKSFLEWTAGIEIVGGALSFVSFGGAEVPTQMVEGAEVANAASKVVRVLKDLLELARGVAATISAVLTRIGEIAGDLTKFLRADEEIAEVEEASEQDAMAAVRRMGAQGERDAGIVKNTRRIESATGKARYRIPDELNDTTLGEVKNVKKQGMTSQLQDFLSYAKTRNPPLEFKLYVRPGTEIVGRLASLVQDGQVTLVRSLPKVP